MRDPAPPRVAFFGFQLINTSLQSTTAEEEARVRMLDDAFRKKAGCFRCFKIVPIPSDLREEVLRCPAPFNFFGGVCGDRSATKFESSVTRR
jgi:hypothetical protein